MSALTEAIPDYSPDKVIDLAVRQKQAVRVRPELLKRLAGLIAFIGRKNEKSLVIRISGHCSLPGRVTVLGVHLTTKEHVSIRLEDITRCDIPAQASIAEIRKGAQPYLWPEDLPETEHPDFQRYEEAIENDSLSNLQKTALFALLEGGVIEEDATEEVYAEIARVVSPQELYHPELSVRRKRAVLYLETIGQ